MMRRKTYEDDYVDPDSERTTRLTRLVALLDHSTSGAASAHETHGNRLDFIADGRLRNLAAMLDERSASPQIDVEDALVMRLLLDDYARAVRHLRAVVGETHNRLNHSVAVIKEGRRAVALARNFETSLPVAEE